MASGNPYHAPVATGADLDALADGAQSWKAIARRWEILRIPYNLLVGAVGVIVLLMADTPWSVILLFDIALYGLAANVLYLLGPVSDMYLNWLADAGEQRLLPNFVVRVVRSWLPTMLIFGAGTLFAVLVTALAGVAVLGPLFVADF